LRVKFPFIIIFLVFLTLSALSQVDRGGVPRSFQFQEIQKSALQVTEVTPPDLILIQKEDNEAVRLEKSYRVGVEIAYPVSLLKAGQWEYLPQGGRICRLSIQCKGAQGIGLNYNSLQLPSGSDIFVYTPDHQNVIGAFTTAEIPKYQKFTTRPLQGDEIVIEYYEPIDSKGEGDIEISGLVYMYRGFEPTNAKEGNSVSSGSCEVNVNCEEGQNWQNQKQGVVKILTKVGPKYFYCTGSVINNTQQDFTGLLLTASHCSEDFSGGTSSDEDYNQWVFYFNYESPGCVTSGSAVLSMVGAQKLATSLSSTDLGSDFLLLKFNGDIPASYNPYYCGWDAGYGNSASGVCIHHPDGDVKKISTYSSMLGSGTWGSTPNTHWIVTWAQTPNGYGVTEGGSSGSPLFDEEGLVIGTLTGGESSCSNPTGQDMFGKVAFSWISNGTNANQQLKPWLDPGNTGILKMPGSYNEKLAIADFSANTRVIAVGGSVDFQDLSAGKPDKWHWYFQGGKPSESSEQNPTGILFERYGAMNVKLVVTNSYNSDSLTKEGYIDVKAIVSPNPSTGIVNILTDINNSNDLIIEVFDGQGKIVQRFDYVGSSSSSYMIQLPDFGNIFIIRVIQGGQVQAHKVLVVHKK
jgi:PKD repeat protein